MNINTRNNTWNALALLSFSAATIGLSGCGFSIHREPPTRATGTADLTPETEISLLRTPLNYLVTDEFSSDVMRKTAQETIDKVGTIAQRYTASPEAATKEILAVLSTIENELLPFYRNIHGASAIELLPREGPYEQRIDRDMLEICDILEKDCARLRERFKPLS